MPFMSLQVHTRGEGRPVVVLPSFSLDHNAMAEVVEPVFAATAGLARRLPPRVGGLLLMCTGFKIRPQDRNLVGVLPSNAEPGWLADVPANLHDHFIHAIGCQTTAVANRVAAVLARNVPADESYLAALRSDGFPLSDEDAPTPCSAPLCISPGAATVRRVPNPGPGTKPRLRVSGSRPDGQVRAGGTREIIVISTGSVPSLA